MTARRTRFLLYCHNALGLGHLARTGAIAAALRAFAPESDILVVTGAATTGLLGKDIAYVKLPSARLVPADGRLEPRAAHLSIPFGDLVALRSALIRTTVTHFKPDVMLVDHNPAGFYHELDQTLDALGRGQRETLLVLGLRGVAFGSLDRTELFEGYWDYLTDVYHRILVYTDPRILSLRIPPAIVPKVSYAGYVARASASASLPSTRAPQMVVATGSGSVGYVVVAALLEIAKPLIAGGWEILVALGPSMDSDQALTLTDRAARLGAGVTIVPFLQDLPDCLARADIFVGRAGYNTLADVMAARCRAIVVPYEVPMGDQLRHARAVESAGLVTVVREQELTPARLRAAIEATVATPRPKRRVDTAGADYTARYLLSLAGATGRGEL